MMIQAVTGDQGASLDTRTAVSLVMFWESMAMKKAFAQSGKASAVVLPDDRAIIDEIVQLVPALVSHEGLDGEAGEEERLDHLTQAELEALLRGRLGENLQELADEYLGSLKTGVSEATKSALEKIPKPLQWLAQKVGSTL
jgi:hypothetical protein